MKKGLFILMLLLTLFSSASPYGGCFSKNTPVNDTDKRSRSSKIEIKRISSHHRARSEFSHVLVFQFEDKLEITARKQFAARIEITGRAGEYQYRQVHSLSPFEKITIDISRYETGNYNLGIILSDDDYYVGDFSIEGLAEY